MSKYITITTFPNQAWYDYLHVCTMSYMQKFDKDVPLLIKIYKDDMIDVVNESLTNLVNNGCKEKEGRKVHIETGSTKEENDFFTRHANFKNDGDYRTNYVDFAHKIFALYQAYLFAKQQNVEYIIWFDADIVVREETTIEDLDKWIGGNDIVYLGRKDWDHSECGFVAYKTETAGKFIERFHEMYVNDEVLNHPQYHDSYIFDVLRGEFPDLKYKNLSENISGRDVFNESPLGEKFTHYKGPLEKQKILDAVNKRKNGDINGSIGVNDVAIKTKNCIDKELIRQNISRNVRLIRNWFEPCKETDEVIILCSAGPSLDVLEIKKQYDRGLKIVAVKHAIKPLQKAGIVPWAVILLDPRPHVADFVDDIDPRTIVFVASMVDPIVTERVIERKLNIIGYHAAVGANEHEFARNGDAIIIGGSATATRGISLLEGLGFRNIELYGYDCCYYEKPDLKKTKEDGTLIYQEITLEAETYLGDKQKRTFWTEGQFLAQFQEFRSYYLERKCLNLNVHGDGMIGWLARNRAGYLKYLEEQDKKVQQDAPYLDNYLKRLQINGG